MAREIQRNPAQMGDAEREERREAPLKIGDWYQLSVTERDDDGKKTVGKELVCITHVGTNYAELTNKNGATWRIHFDAFEDLCVFEPNAPAMIAEKIRGHQVKAAQLMGRVQEITERLAIAPNAGALPAGNETQALALRGGGESVEGYKAALSLAKDKTLPELFKAIEEENEAMGKWMKAGLIPLKAQAQSMRPALKAIESRIFNVELYAGLVETVEQIADGEPAPIGAKLSLFQRRAYMDEECLANYRAGGMEYRNLHEFDAWLVRAENLSRILPHPRCIIAFQVRRHTKERQIVTISDFIRIKLGGIEDADKFTFLYIRNGDRVYRLNTKIEFGHELFPDVEHHILNKSSKEQIYFHRRSNNLITKSQYDEMVQREQHAEAAAEAEYQEKLVEYKKHEHGDRHKLAVHKLAERQYKIDRARFDAAYAIADEAAKKRGKKHENGGLSWTPPSEEEVGVKCPSRPTHPEVHSSPWKHHVHIESDEYEPYTIGSVYYDDVTAHLHEEMERHNRLVLVLQGLLDRSPVLHPHPAWKLWEPVGFAAALDLVFDSTRGLVAGEKPDFEAYRAKLNESLTTGSWTVGQEIFWEHVEAVKENARRQSNWRDRNRDDVERFRPQGNPGPGRLAQVTRFSPTKGCKYEWWRRRVNESWRHDAQPRIQCQLFVPPAEVLNVSAYTPGDFKRFFADPRTRAEYLQWAPMLLEAEEFHAGNRPDGKRRVEEDES